MSWKKYFTPVETGSSGNGSYSTLGGPRGGNQPGPARTNYSSYLPDVYMGTPNRVDRYGQYNTMDMDSEVNAALDILAEFCTQRHGETNLSFRLNFNTKATNVEITILEQYLKQWNKLNNFQTRLFRIMRNVFKYGDAFFVRDPETKKWFHVDPANVNRIIVNESEGKTPEQYIIKDFNLNFREMVATTPFQTNGNITGGGAANYQTGGARGMVGNVSGATTGNRFQQAEGEVAINAEHVIHLSLSEGLDNNFPFGNSLLETIFKVFKQKELLEDAIIIYRVQRAPERRVFYVDVGNMPSHLAMQFVERVKTEIHQRRIPSKTGGGTNVIDSSYNPLSINEDYFFPQTAEGRGSKVETLPGGENLGQIDDLKYFNNKMCRGLRVPSSYLPTGPDDSDRPMNDGRVGTALIQEHRFNQYCERLQKQVSQKLDDEFKMFLRWRGFNIDSGLFTIKFAPPQNFASYRQAELDTTRMQAFSTLEQLPYMSKRFLMKRYLGLTDDELQENSKLWSEETAQPGDLEPMGKDLRTVGVSPADFDADIQTASDIELGGDDALDVDTAAPVAAETPPA